MNKVQNISNKNILVQSDGSGNRHLSHMNKEVEIVRVLTGHQILEKFNEVTKKDLVDFAKDWICKKDGYAISNVSDESKGIRQGDIVKFKQL